MLDSIHECKKRVGRTFFEKETRPLAVERKNRWESEVRISFGQGYGLHLFAYSQITGDFQGHGHSRVRKTGAYKICEAHSGRRSTFNRFRGRFAQVREAGPKEEIRGLNLF